MLPAIGPYNLLVNKPQPPPYNRIAKVSIATEVEAVLLLRDSDAGGVELPKQEKQLQN